MLMPSYMYAKTNYSLERAAKRRNTEEAVKSNIEQAQKKQKEYYDLKHGAAAYASTLARLS